MAFIVNFEHISYIILQLILLNSNKKNDVWDWESVVSDSKFVSSNWEIYWPKGWEYFLRLCVYIFILLILGYERINFHGNISER